VKAPDFRPVAKEELPEAPWIGKLLEPLNRFLLAVRQLLANGLTFADNFNAEIRTIEFTTLAGTPDRLALFASRSATPQAFVSGSLANVRFDVEGLDTHDAYDPSTGTFTAPEAGLYSVSTTVALDGLTAGTGYMYVRIRKNGGTTEVRGTRHGISGTAQAESASAIINLAAGDTLEVTPLHTNVSTRSTEALALATHLSIVKLDGSAAKANGAFPIRWKSKVRGKVTGMTVLRCVEVVERNEKPVLAAVSVDWAQDGENTIIRNVAGLTGGKTYRLTLAALGS
jgi:hypothetical protein